MNFKKLLDEGKIEVVEKKEFDLKPSENDLEFAKKGLETKNYNRVMTIAYEAVLRASNRLMNFLGYRAIGKEHHKNVFEFLKETELEQDLVEFFNKIRIKRNNFIYRDIEVISEDESGEIIKKAEEFVQKIRTFVQKIRTYKAKEKV